MLHRIDKDREKYGYYSNFLRYYLMLRNDIYLWLRGKTFELLENNYRRPIHHTRSPWV